MVQFYPAKRAQATDKRLTLTIRELDAFGQGVAHYHGKAIFVQGGLPGETAEVRLIEEKRQFARAVMRRCLVASKERVPVRCRHFAQCGGCQQQHVSIRLQHSSKADALARLLKHPVDEVISGASWGYRRRARLSLHVPAGGRALQMGFRQSASRALVDVRHCPVLAPQLEALLPALRDCLSALVSVRKLGHVELVLADNGVVLVLRHLRPLPPEDKAALLAFAGAQAVSLFLADNSDRLEQVTGQPPCYHSHGLPLTFSPRDFIQVNDQVNQQMVARAVQWLAVRPEDRLLDLFCGMGNFTLPLAKYAGAVIGVEGVAALVAAARANAHALGLTNVQFFQQDLQQLTQAQWASQKVDKVLLDPSRAGAGDVLHQVAALRPQRLVYVSCHPATLARDSDILRAAGYQLTRLAMLDMFPHTGHTEAMALFR